MKLLIAGFFVIMTAGVMLRSSPVKNTDLSQLDQKPNGVYIVNAEVQPNGDGYVSVRDANGVSVSGYYLGDKVGFGKVEIEKSGAGFTIKSVTIDSGALEEGVMTEVRNHNGTLYGRVVSQQGSQFVQFNKNGVVGYQK